MVLKFTNSIDDNGIGIRKFGSTKASNESWTGQSYIPPAKPENRPWYDHVGVGSVHALLGLLGGVQLVAPIPDRVQDLEDDVTEEKKKAHAEEQNLETAQRLEEKLKDEKDKAERDAKDKKKEGKQEWEKNEHHFHNK